MTRILAIETSTEACSCALQLNDTVLEYFEIAPRQHSALVLEMINKLLSDGGVTLQSLDMIAFGCGPGSFMGTRLASSVAMGLAFAVEVPLRPISSLRALAQKAYVDLKATYIAAAWDARMGEIYCGAYREKEGIVHALMPDQLSPPAALKLPDVSPITVWTLVGNGWHTYSRDLPLTVQALCPVSYPTLYPQSSMVAGLAAHDAATGVSEGGELQYLRQGLFLKGV